MIALVLGGAATVWSDYARAETLLAEAGISHRDVRYFAANDVGAKMPRVDHWVSLHADRLAGWERQRGGPKDWTTWTHSDPYGLADKHLPHEGGSSGAYAVTVALHLGAERVILCGIPLESRHTHFFQTPDGKTQPFDEAGRFRQEWVENGLVEKWRGTVRSMSGWTREKMGEPDIGWLRGEHGNEAAA